MRGSSYITNTTRTLRWPQGTPRLLYTSCSSPGEARQEAQWSWSYNTHTAGAAFAQAQLDQRETATGLGLSFFGDTMHLNKVKQE